MRKTSGAYFLSEQKNQYLSGITLNSGQNCPMRWSQRRINFMRRPAVTSHGQYSVRNETNSQVTVKFWTFEGENV